VWLVDRRVEQLREDEGRVREGKEKVVEECS
jgi:hypothetical protein